jgi:hypothetical protein
VVAGRRDGRVRLTESASTASIASSYLSRTRRLLTCIPREDDPEIWSKHVVGKNNILLIVGSCVDGIVRII